MPALPPALIDRRRRWTHRTAWLLAVGTFPLIWMGGLVTTYRAGMAVPDWPGTYGYLLFFLYPLDLWLGVWDVFLEHSHRMLGALVGLFAIALAVVLWRWDPRPGMRWMGVLAVVFVSLQGTLGGLRVLVDEVLLANIHGCTAPLFFALTAALVTLTSPRWLTADAPQRRHGSHTLRRAATTALVAVFVQIVLGAQVRHLPPNAPPGWFTLWVWLHVIAAFAVLGLAIWVSLVAGRMAEPVIVRRARWLLGLVGLQVVLGLTTWVVNWGFPSWFEDYVFRVEYTVVAGGALQAWITTAHVAIGSLTLVAALSVVLWSGRLLRSARGWHNWLLNLQLTRQ